MRPEVFLEAAKVLRYKTKRDLNDSDSGYCCDVISVARARIYNEPVNYQKGCEELSLFRSLYSVDSDCSVGIFWLSTRSDNAQITKKTQNARLLALLFAYEIAKDEQNEKETR